MGICTRRDDDGSRTAKRERCLQLQVVWVALIPATSQPSEDHPSLDENTPLREENEMIHTLVYLYNWLIVYTARGVGEGEG